MSKKKTPTQKATANPKSLRCAVNAMCWDCVGGDSDPASRWRIGNCPITNCPLYPLRPYKKLYLAPTPQCLQNAVDEKK